MSEPLIVDGQRLLRVSRDYPAFVPGVEGVDWDDLPTDDLIEEVRRRGFLVTKA